MKPGKTQSFVLGVIFLYGIYLTINLIHEWRLESDKEKNTVIRTFTIPVQAPPPQTNENAGLKDIEEAAHKVAGQSPRFGSRGLQSPLIWAFQLTQIGEAEALKGYVVHAPGKVFAVEQGKAYSPFAPNDPVQPPQGAIAIELPSCSDGKSHLALDLLLGPAEIPIVLGRGSLGKISDAYAVLSQSETPGAGPLGVQLAEKHLRVFDGKREVAKLDFALAALPCSIIIDDLDGKPGNEIALIWASIAAGYTMGVTIFDLRENIN